MSKKQSRKQHPHNRILIRKKKLLSALTLTIIVVASVSLLAQVNLQKKNRKAAGEVSVASFAPTEPSKEYVYAGSRLIATEESPSQAQTDDALFASQAAPPATMTPGQTANVSITMTNTGTSTWTSGVYFLGSQNPQANTVWGLSQVPLSTTVISGGQAIFNFVVTAPATAGTYNFQWQMKNGSSYFGGTSTNVIVQVSATPVNNASFVTQSVPSSMTPGQTASVSITISNSGTTTWTTGTGYSLGSQNPAGNMTWGLNQAALSSSVSPGSSFTFMFNITAPSTAGSYNFQWQMQQSGVYFGSLSTNVAINVSSTPPTDNAGFVSQTVPSTLSVGQVSSVSITMRNTGTTTWSVGSYFLGSQSPQGNSTWGFSQVALPSSVAPGAQVTFAFNITAPASAGSYTFQWQMKKGSSYFGALTTAANITVTAPSSDNASFVSQTVSSFMALGSGQSVTVVMSNTGNTTWTQANYVLRSQNPAGNTTWGLSDVGLPIATVAPGANAIFTFTITAPGTAGDYHFEWQMYKIGGSFFGAQSTDTVITVGTDPPPPAPTLLSATPSGSNITLLWQNNTQSNYIQVERKLGSGAYSVIAPALSPSTTTYVDPSLAPGTHTYRVRCFVGNGTASPYSNELSATIGGSNPPNAPSNLAASLGAGLSVNLTWTDNSGDETGFKIERKTETGSYQLIATVGVNITSYTDTTVSYSTNYTYRVRAINGALESAYSNEASVTTGPPPPPNAPSDLSANVVSSTRVDLAWLDNSSNEDGFKVERKTGTGSFSVIATLGVNATSYSDTSAVASTQYTYRVRAFSSAGGDSTPSNEVIVTTPAPPPPPTSPTALVATATSSSQINLTWTDNSTNEDGFKVERKQGVGGTYAQIATTGPNTASYSDMGLAASTTYYYRVRAYNSVGDSAYSNEASATTQASGTCPQISTISGDGVYGYAEGATAKWRKPVGGAIGKDPATELLALFVADTENHRIRKVMLEGANSGQSSLIAGDGTAGYYDGVTVDNNGPDPLTARYNHPRGITAQLDANGVATTLLIADTSNNRIRRLSWNSSAGRFTSSLVSGSGVGGLVNGSSGVSRFNAPQALTYAPDGNIYVADTGNAVIRKVTSSGTSSTVVAAGTFSSPTGITASSTSVLYVSDAGNHKVFQVSGSTGTAIAGSGSAGFADGTGAAAMFNAPAQLVWSNPASGSVLYVADQSNHRIRALTISNNAVSTLAGSGVAGFADGSCAAAQFSAPRGAAYLSSTGAVYVIDSSNNRIRKVQ